MKKLELRGVIPPVVTPFKYDKKQSVDEESLRETLEFLIENGVHGVVMCAAVGEGLYLSPDERRKVVGVSVDKVDGKVPVIATIWNAGTSDALKTAKEMKEIGAEAILAFAPYLHHPSDKGIFEHFRTLAEDADIAVVMYNNPRFCGYNINPEVIAKLAKIDNVTGIKETTHDLMNIVETIRLCKEDMAVIAGAFDLFLPMLYLGGAGCITGYINCLPRLHVNLFESFEKGDFKKAIETYYKILPLFKLGANPANVKEVLNMLGRDAGPPRMPLLPPEKEHKEDLRQALNGVLRGR